MHDVRANSSPVRIETSRLVLTMPPPEAAVHVVRHHRDNEEHLAPWEPPRGSEYLSEMYWRDRLRKHRTEFTEKSSLKLFLFLKGARPGEILGVCNFTRFARGPLLSCMMGYHIDRNAEGRGYMVEAGRAAIDYVFTNLGVSRIEATHDATNLRSSRVLARLGFVVEGSAKEYLFTNGAWRDHVITALTRRALTPSPPLEQA